MVHYTFSEPVEGAIASSKSYLTPIGAINANTIRQAIHSIGLKRSRHTDEDIIAFCEGYASEKAWKPTAK